MFKYALFLVCALVAVQGFQARSVEADEAQLQGIIDTIKELIEKIKNIINNISGSIGEIIKNVVDKIKEVLGQIPEIIAAIRDKIQEIINLGEVGKKCVEAHQADIQDIINTAQNGMQACAAAAQDQTQAIRDQFDVLVKTIVDAQNQIVSSVVKCIEDNKLNPIKLFNCLKAQVDPIRQQIVEIEAQVAKTIEVAREVAQQAAADLAVCVQKVQQEVSSKEQALFAALQKCVQEGTQ